MILRLIPLIVGLIIIFFIFKGALEEAKFRIREELNKMRVRRAEAKEVVEPPSKILRGNGSMMLRIKMPRVSIKDIHLRKLGDSLEVKAKSGERIYFKLFPVQKNYRIVNKKLEGEELIVELER
jgi:HSP20 family molecular chaperone IbpA